MTKKSAKAKKISYVFPVYNEVEGIEEFYNSLVKAVKKSPYEYEFIFVNDGSTDGSLEKLEYFYKTDPRVKVISFSRNFGHQLAITAGLDACRCRCRNRYGCRFARSP